MTTRLQNAYEFSVILKVVDAPPLINHYALDAHFVVVTDNYELQNLAFQRVSYYVESILNGAVFVDQADTETIKQFQNLQFRVVQFPTVPVDQIVNMMLFSKLNAIMEDQLVVTDLALCSDLCGGVRYLHADEDDLGIFAHDGWWSESDPTYFKKEAKRAKNVLKIESKVSQAWREFGLAWPEHTDAKATNVLSMPNTKKNNPEE
jgi:hypothetical protein